MRSSFELDAPAEGSGEGMTARERSDRYGLMCEEFLQWSGSTWSPGGEFTKRLTLLNTTARTLHVRYTLPTTKLFFMEFPDKIELSPGLSVSLDVRFRPVRFEEYYDSITFTTDHGSFSVPIRALLARLAVSVPPELVFGVVPVNEPTVATLGVRNEGEVEALFDWKVASPFLLSPKTGRVAPGTTFPVTVTVMPGSAAILSATAVCVVQGGELRLPVALSAHGKYQHVEVGPATVEWGVIPVGAVSSEVLERVVSVRNLGAVRATVSAERLGSPLDGGKAAGGSLISVRPDTLALQPGASAEFRLRLSARTAGMRTVERFRFSSPGGGSTTVTGIAAVAGPRLTIARRDTGAVPVDGSTSSVKLPSTSVLFVDARVGSVTTQVVVLTNPSREAAAFDLECEEGGVFGFSETKGVVLGGHTRSLVVRFSPTHPGNYYKRVQCLVLNGDACFVDVLGTAFDDKTRPAPLRQRHVNAARLRPTGMRFLAPDAMLRAVREGLGVDGASQSGEAEWALTVVRSRSGDRSRAANALYRDYFAAPTAADRPVVLSASLLDFKPARRSATSVEVQTVHIMNRSAGKVHVQWLVPPSEVAATPAPGGLRAGDGASLTVQAAGGARPTDFTIKPAFAEIDPGSSAEFAVAFKPSADSYYYLACLEAWVSPKVNRSFRLVDDASFTPPQALPLTVMGHSFADAEAFSPRVSTSFGGTQAEQALVLPPCSLGDSVYYTFQLANAGEVPTAYDFSADPSGVFTVQPNVGMLPLRSFQLITVRFTPRFARAYGAALSLTLNHDVSHTVHIALSGVGDTPRLLLPDGGAVYIKPTSVGIASSRVVILRNASALPLRYELRVPAEHAAEIALSSTQGDIEGGGTADLRITFAPRVVGAHSIVVPVAVYPLTGSETNALVLLNAAETGANVGLLEERMHAGIDASSSAAECGGGGRREAGDPLQRLALHIVSEGTLGALSFDTRHLDFGAAIVHGRVSAPLYVENASDCSLRYELDAVLQVQLSSVDLDRDDSGIVEASEVDEEFNTARWYTAGSSPPRAAKPEGGPKRGNFNRTVALSLSDPAASFRSEAPGDVGSIKRILSFDKPTGVIAAHSRVRIEVAFAPPIAGTFKARLYYRIVPDNESEGTGLTPPAFFSASRAVALEAASRAEEDPRDPSMVDWDAEPKNASPLMCDAVGIGAYPSVCVEDVRGLASREALLTLFPRHFAGLHNAFAPERVADKADLLTILGLDEGSVTSIGSRGAAGGGLAAVAALARGSASSVSPRAAAPPVAAPRPSPNDLWVRPGAWDQKAAVCGSAQPTDRGWGGWTFALPGEVRNASSGLGSAMPSPGKEQLPVPTAPELLELLPAPYVEGLDIVMAPPTGPIPSTALSPWRLWSQFSLRDLNRYLSLRLSPAEVAFNTATQMTRDPTKLAAFPLEFAPAPLGSPPSVAILSFRNNGRLPAYLSLSYPHERDVDVEPWVEIDEPSADELQDNELLERRVFGITPRALSLLPGQSATIRFHYAYASLLNEGAHEIVVMLRVRNGKPVRLLLRGRTLPAATPYLYCAVPSRSLRLAPVPLGTRSEEVPEQSIALFNPSSVPVRWRMGGDSFAALARDNFGFPVIKALITGGVIPAGGEGALTLAFTPLEARTYTLRLNIAFVALGTGSQAGVAEEKEGEGGRGGASGADTRASTGEDRALRKLLRAASDIPSSAGAEAQPGGMPDVGVGLASGAKGFEADYPGVLILSLSATGYRSVNDVAGNVGKPGPHLPLVPSPATIGLGLAPPLPPVDDGAAFAFLFESTHSSEQLPSPGSHLVPHSGAAKRRNSAFAPPRSTAAGGIMGRAEWGVTAAHDAISDGVYLLSGLDTLSAAVASGHNPLEQVTAAVTAGVGEDGGRLQSPAAALERVALSAVRVFSGPDAGAAAGADAQLSRARSVLASLLDGAAESGYVRSGLPELGGAFHSSSSSSTDAPSTLYRLMSRMSSPPVLKALYRPGSLPPLFVGAFPPARPFARPPHADIPEGFASFTAGAWSRFGDVAVGGVAHTLLVLRHSRLTAGDGPGTLSCAADARVAPEALAFAFDTSHPLLASGTLSFTPSAGLIAPGGAVAIRVTLSAGSTPAVLTVDVPCLISVSSHEQRAQAGAMLSRAYELHEALRRQRGLVTASLPTGEGHVSVADKTTLSRSFKLEANARDLAWRVGTRAAAADKAAGVSNYSGAAAVKRAADASTHVPGMAPGGRPPPGPGLRTVLSQGNAVHLHAARAASMSAAAEDDTSIVPTVGGDRSAHAAELALARSALAVPLGGSSSHSTEASGMLDQLLPSMSGLGAGLPAAPQLDSKDIGRLLIRSVVQEGLAGGSRLVLDTISQAGGMPPPLPALGVATAATKTVLEADGATTRRVRIAGRARHRLSPPRQRNDVTSVTSATDSRQSAERRGGAGGIDTSRLALPPPPHAVIHVHVTARVAGHAEFTRAYSAAHLGAFFHPGGGVEAFVAGEPAAAAAAVASRDGAGAAAVGELLAELVSEAAAAVTGGGGEAEGGEEGGEGGEGEPAPTARSSSRGLVDGSGLTYTSLRAARGDMARVPSRAQARAAGAGAGASIPVRSPGVVPPPRANGRDVDVVSDASAAAVLHTAWGREAVASLLEEVLRSLGAGLLDGSWTPLDRLDTPAVAGGAPGGGEVEGDDRPELFLSEAEEGEGGLAYAPDGDGEDGRELELELDEGERAMIAAMAEGGA